MSKIALCAGHHEDAKGAVNRKHGLNEHDEMKKVVAFLAAILAHRGHDVRIFIGRLSEKIAAVNAEVFELALDIHCNAGGGRGCEIVYVPGSNVRKLQAEVISKEFALFTGMRDRGAKEGWWAGSEIPKPDAFVSQTDCPAFIPELLFIDDDDAVEKWLVAGRHDQLAEALANGIEEAGWKAYD